MTETMTIPEYVVGIGASAGGLEALERFFLNVSPDSSAAYVVIQHLSPDFKSMMSEILARKTDLTIHAATDEMKLEANHIYLNTPRHDLRVEENQISLTPTIIESRIPPRPIDTFFESLAKSKGPKAICVVLSGTGTDGSLGSAAVSAAGGLVITQDAESALFSSMPQSASSQGPADMVLPPDEIPAAIVDFIESDVRISSGDLSLLDYSLMTGENAFSYLLSILQREYDIDYTLYKPQTLVRRVERRMSLNQYVSLTSYIHALQEDKEELEALFRDVMVDVTSFFRDKLAFDFLESEVIPRLVANKGEFEPLRIWIAGCASGEEAYSLTILFLEEIERQRKNISFKAFATDAHRQSIMRAGSGIYTESRVEDIPEQYQQKYFTSVDDTLYQIRPEVRQKIVFAPHNLLTDAHFTNLDLISCRNVLIYLRSEAQANVLSRFHIGLRRNGFLFLGASEHLGPFEDDYEPLNRQLRIYEKVRDSISLSGREIGASRIQLRDTVRTDSYRLPSQTWERGLLAHLIFTGFVVDEHGTLQQIYGDAPQYVNFKAGHVNLALTHVIHDDLSTPIRTGLFQAQKENKVVTFEQIAVSKGDNVTSVTIKISPFIIDPSTDESTRYYLIQLSEGKTVRKAVQPPGSSSPIEDLDRISGLERELAFTRESLQTTIEAVETTNEELQSSNEELIAANEELQSTNEELSSVNEELYTVNSEYQGQNQRLHRANQDMQNLLRSGGILAIFLDRKLRLRIITPGINDLFGLQEGDIGRPLLHFSTFAMIGNHRLENMMQAALEGTEQEETMTLIDGGTLHMKVLPYFEEDQTINGVVLYFVER